LEPLRSSLRWKNHVATQRGEPLPLIPPGYVLLRVKYASWTGVEEAVRSGHVVARYGVVMGFSGVGQPLEAAGATPPPARLLAPVRLVDDWLPGVSDDGWLSEYTVAPLSALEEAPSMPVSALSLHLSLACSVVEEVLKEGAVSLLVAGGGVSGYAAALLAAEKGLRVALFTSKKLRCRGCGILNSPPSGGFEAVYAASPSRWWIDAAIEGASPRLVVVTPFSPPPRARNIAVREARGTGGSCWKKLAEKLVKEANTALIGADGLLAPPHLGEVSLAYLVRIS
jgi:hypothetical protein